MKLRDMAATFEDTAWPTNDERAVKAGLKVKGYAGEKAEDVEADVIDLLVDLRHYCDATGLDFGRINRTAQHYHEEEVGQQGLAKKTWED